MPGTCLRGGQIDGSSYLNKDVAEVSNAADLMVLVCVAFQNCGAVGRITSENNSSSEPECHQRPQSPWQRLNTTQTSAGAYTAETSDDQF